MRQQAHSVASNTNMAAGRRLPDAVIDKNWEASVNFNNLTDRTYLRTVGYTGYYNSYGDPRNVLLTVRAKF